MRLMNKKAFFSKGAYKDAMRRLLFPGIASAAFLLILETVMLLYVNNHVKGMEGASEFMHYTYARLAFPQLSIFLVISPLLLLYLFQFQFGRAGSDCFHALPLTKKSRAFSYYAAVLSVDAALLIISGLWVEGLSAILPYVRMGEENRFFLTLGCYMAASVFTASLMLLALSLSGTWLSALCMYAILLVVPRLLLLIAEMSIFGGAVTIPEGLNGTILDRHLNVVTSLISVVLSGEAYDAVKSAGSLLYTLLTGLILLVPAVLLHGKRSSETAGHPAVHPRVQGAFRVALGSAVGIFSLLMLDTYEWKGFAFLTLLTLAAYLIYELLLTRSLLSCLRALPAFLYVILGVLLFQAALWGGESLVKNDLAKADQVRSIAMTFRPQSYYGFPESVDYYCTSMRAYKIRDKEAIEILCEALRKTEEEKYSGGGGETLVLYFEGGPFFKKREVFLEQDKLDRLFATLEKDEAYRDIFLKPVEREQVESIESFANRYSGSAPEGNTDELYEVYCDAVAKYGEADFEEMVLSHAVIHTGGFEALEVFLKDGRVQRVYLQGASPDGISYPEEGPDALLEAFTDIRTGAGEKALAELAYPEDGDTVDEAPALVYVDFCNVTPNFSAGVAGDELSAHVLSQSPWCLNLQLTPEGWDRAQERRVDEICEDKIFELFRRTRYWNGWGVTDTSAPYIRVRYMVFQHYEGEPEMRTLKEFESCYRLEPELLSWLGAD